MAEIVQRLASVLIIAPPSRMRDALQAVVRALSQIGDVDRADDGPSALRAMARNARTVVMLDEDLSGDGVGLLLEQIKAGWPQTRCILLIGDDPLRRTTEADSTDAVLVKGFSTATLVETIDRLLLRLE